MNNANEKFIERGGCKIPLMCENKISIHEITFIPESYALPVQRFT